MTKKSKFIKNILTTASATAMILAGVNAAYAEDRETAAGGGAATAADNGVVANINPGGNWAPGSSLLLKAGDSIAPSAAGDLTIAHILTEAGPADPGIIVTNNNLSIGAVSGADSVNAQVTAGKILTLTGIEVA